MRVVHNTTFHVDKAIEKEWVAAILHEYIPLVACPGALFTRIREAGDDPAFSLQFPFDGEEAYRRFVERGELAALSRRFPGGFLYFCTTLEEVDHES
jgi:hypothetical protein